MLCNSLLDPYILSVNYHLLDNLDASLSIFLYFSFVSLLLVSINYLFVLYFIFIYGISSVYSWRSHRLENTSYRRLWIRRQAALRRSEICRAQRAGV